VLQLPGESRKPISSIRFISFNDLYVQLISNDIPSVYADRNNLFALLGGHFHTERSLIYIWDLNHLSLFDSCYALQTLRQCGTNFSLIQTFFPGRTRDAVKKKFQRLGLYFPFTSNLWSYICPESVSTCTSLIHAEKRRVIQN
jgi:hypothetical protein